MYNYIYICIYVCVYIIIYIYIYIHISLCFCLCFPLFLFLYISISYSTSILSPVSLSLSIFVSLSRRSSLSLSIFVSFSRLSSLSSSLSHSASFSLHIESIILSTSTSPLLSSCYLLLQHCHFCPPSPPFSPSLPTYHVPDIRYQAREEVVALLIPLGDQGSHQLEGHKTVVVDLKLTSPQRPPRAFSDKKLQMYCIKTQ